MKYFSSVLMFFVILSSIELTAQVRYKTQAYEPEWESLIQHPEPEWFKDVKFGIYFHWGVYSVPAFGNEWYPRNMYIEKNPTFEYHKETWGDQNEFGYKDFIPMFRAEYFDADEWIDLFVKAGARFVGPVAEHHDGFAMWDSKLTDWDACDMGPKRDIAGELAEAARKRGLKFMMSFHHARKWRHFQYAYNYDAKDPRYAGLYGPPHHESEEESQAYLENWLGKLIECVDKYEPDYMWFDFGWREKAFEPYKREYLAYYYNKAEEWGKNVVVSYKGDHLPLGAGVLDLERGRLDHLRKDVWITDTSIDKRSWCYIENPDLKSVNTMVDNLVDRVSKNGNTLMNIAPRADGTIPEEQKERLLGIGEWLKVNGEAIYGTRYWKQYGEGPTEFKGGSFIDGKELKYTSEDIRFTTKGNCLYAITLDWPGDFLLIKSLADLDDENISSVTLLGNKGELAWEMIDEGMKVHFPGLKPCEHAYSVRIERKDER